MSETETKTADREANETLDTAKQSVGLIKELNRIAQKEAEDASGSFLPTKDPEKILDHVPNPGIHENGPQSFFPAKDASEIAGDAPSLNGRKAGRQESAGSHGRSLPQGRNFPEAKIPQKPQSPALVPGAKKTASGISEGVAVGAKTITEAGKGGAAKAGAVAGSVGCTGVLLFLLVLLVILVAFVIAYSVYEASDARGRSGEVQDYWITDNRPLTETERKQNAICVYRHLKNESFSINAIAAVLANMEVESTINPGRWENGQVRLGGYGLCQWTPYTKLTEQEDFIEDNGDMQMAYFLRTFDTEWIQKSGFPSASEFREGQASAEELAAAFLFCYERPRDLTSTLDDRKQKAAVWKAYLAEHGEEELKKRESFTFTMEDLRKCKSRQEYLSLVMPAYAAYGKEFGIRYPGILALQVFYEVNASFPQEMSTVALTDHNFGGLKYAPGIPRASRGSPYPASEGQGVYCHFETPGDYIYAQSWNVGQSIYGVARKQRDVEGFTRSLCAIWIKGNLCGSTEPVGYSEQLLNDYRSYHLDVYER